MGLSSFVDIDIFVMKYLFLPILHFSRISQIKIYKMLRPQKGNSRVSLNDTLLNFGLRCTCTQLCYMTFWALEHLSCFVGLPVPVTFYVMYIKPVFSQRDTGKSTVTGQREHTRNSFGGYCERKTQYDFLCKIQHINAMSYGGYRRLYKYNKDDLFI